MRIDFNKNWKFKEGTGWRVICLPHDAMIESPRQKDAAGGAACAYFDGGIYEYEKVFSVPAEWEDKTAWLEFGGVYRNSKVYVNGNLAGEWAYGYSEFSVLLNDFLLYGKENSVRVVADNSKLPNSRWYTGGGIYRPVSLILKNKTHILHRGITISTKSIEPAVIRVQTKCNGGNVRLTVYDGEKRIAAANGYDVEVTIPQAKLWSDESPYLYTLKAELFEKDKLVDEEVLPFGIRTLDWNKDGFFVNGKNTLLRGGCVHHDNGILGACAYAEAEERKVRILKKAGYNAVRFAHNPCSQAFAAACDKFGVYLIDEFSDMWYTSKKKYDYATDFMQWYKKDLAAMVEKDKNHPSVVMYSIGNEVSEPSEQRGISLVKEMTEYIRSLDNTRAVTAGINFFIIVNAAHGKDASGKVKKEEEGAVSLPTAKQEKPTSSVLFNIIATHAGPSMNKMGNSAEADALVSPCLDLLDIAGYNYASGRYAKEGCLHPTRVLYGSETFPQDIWKNWQAVKKYPYLIGDFMWTAWDYLGEVGIGGWSYEPQYGMNFEKPYPWMIADTGAIDILGNIGAEAKYASTVWGLETKPYIGVRPVNQTAKKLVKSVWRGTNAVESWSWKGCEGKIASIEIYSDAFAVVLYLNGKKIGKKKLKECRAVFKTKYVYGTLRAVALDRAGKPVAETSLRSARKPWVRIVGEKKVAREGELLFFDVVIADDEGTVECNADCRLFVEIANGKLAAFDSARQKTEEKYSSPSCETYYGRAMLAVRAGAAGEMKICVRAADGSVSEHSVNIAEQ